ncbi:MAG: LysR family substrate-binding domain-containing protein, partial [Candidatus Dormiibacterota bacterium]
VDSATHLYLPVVLGTYRRRYPHVRVTLVQSTSSVVADGIACGRLDVGLLRPTYGLSTLALEEIGRDELVVALPEDHPLSDHDAVSLQDLAHESFVLFPRTAAPELYATIFQLFDGLDFVPRITEEAHEGTTVASLVAAGLGVSVTTQGMGRRGVVYRPIRGQSASIAMCVGWRRASASLPARAFVELAREARASGGLTADPAGPADGLKDASVDRTHRT